MPSSQTHDTEWMGGTHPGANLPPGAPRRGAAGWGPLGNRPRLCTICCPLPPKGVVTTLKGDGEECSLPTPHPFGSVPSTSKALWPWHPQLQKEKDREPLFRLPPAQRKNKALVKHYLSYLL